MTTRSHRPHFLVNPANFFSRVSQCNSAGDLVLKLNVAPNIPQAFIGIMHHASPHRTETSLPSSDRTTLLTPPPTADSSDVELTALQNPVVVFGRRGCCMCHVVKQLFLGHGVNPTVFEVEEGQKEVDLIDRMRKFGGRKDVASLQLPVVFVGGKILGGLETVMAAHIAGDLVPILKAAGALWL